jgi:hypothetical protein
VEQTHRTALQNGLATLCHYEKFNADHLATTLRDNIIHCSNPANLNDPWDCKPAFDPHSLDDPEVLEREIEWRQKHPAKNLGAEQMRKRPQARVDFMLRESESVVNMLAKRRIYCLTPVPDSILMWSHYTDNHRGICLEFNVANVLFSKACEVMYREDYPRWVPCDIDDKRGRVMELILTKAADWLYEKEYRLISIDDPAYSSFLQLHGDYFRLPNGALKSLIMGCEADQKTIGAVVKKWAPSLPIKRAMRLPNRYKLEIVDYSPD